MTRNLHLFVAGFNLALVAWGAFLVANKVTFGGALIVFGIISGASATLALKGRRDG